jgi:hypothetical protein
MEMAQRTVAVDDNAGILKSAARLLARHDIDSLTFASAEPAVRVLRPWPDARIPPALSSWDFSNPGHPARVRDPLARNEGY